MRIRMVVAAAMLAFSVGAISVGCGGPDNAAACQEYVDKVNTLDCYKSVKFTTDCSAYDNTDCDISDYFNCLTDNTKCDAMGNPDSSGTSQCASKAQCN